MKTTKLSTILMIEFMQNPWPKKWQTDIPLGRTWAYTPGVGCKDLDLNVAGLSYDVAPDRQRFLVLPPQCDDSQIRELHVVTNWFEELKRLVPSQEDRYAVSNSIARSRTSAHWNLLTI